jgi:hypothetical protein
MSLKILTLTYVYNLTYNFKQMCPVIHCQVIDIKCAGRVLIIMNAQSCPSLVSPPTFLTIVTLQAMKICA